MILSHDNETIIAQCTPTGSGAIALLRISGLNALEIVNRMSLLPSGLTVDQVPTHTIHYGWVVDTDGDHIDQVLFLVMHAPRTFTGQDTVEITCHNNPFLIDAIIQQALTSGARLAREGEFSKRAVLNDKIDLIQAEAINELIHAQTQLTLKKSLSQLQGSFSHAIGQIERDMIKALAFCQASFEFIDEEHLEFGSQIKNIVEAMLKAVAEIKKTFDQQQQIRQGIRVALIGTVNAGKSSLFNALLNKERAIVSHLAGTTRDTIEASMHKNGNFWTLIDTAGLRITDDVIEQAGIKRSWHEAQLADIILLIYDGSVSMADSHYTVYQQLISQYRHKIITIQTKADITSCINNNFLDTDPLLISNTTKYNISTVEQKIEEKISALFKSIESPYLLNKRQYNLLIGFEKKLTDLLPLLGDNISYELVSYHLEDALTNLSELTGKSVSEAGMDAVFREFCVGK